jgi:hypothetical protein
MKIASFDVGINNLAFCIINATQADVELLDFNLVSIFEENKKFACGTLTGKGKMCGKNAKMTNAACAHFCGTHAPDDAVEITRVNTKLAKLDTIAKNYIIRMADYDFSDCDKIVIENQPSMVSKKIQFVANMLFFDMVQKYPNAKVSYAPRDKWAVYDGPEIKIENSRKSKVRANKKDSDEIAKAKTSLRNKEYKSRKAAGILMAEYFLKKYNETEWLEFFQKVTVDKKDDLADCYLQALTAIKATKVPKATKTPKNTKAPKEPKAPKSTKEKINDEEPSKVKLKRLKTAKKKIIDLNLSDS